MSNRLKNVMEINSFISKNGIEPDSYGNCNFQATIDYVGSNNSATEVAEVKICRNGYSDGAISLKEFGTLSTDDFHLDFNPDFQSYHFNPNSRSLCITGRSPKMGAYSATIIPV